MSDSDESSINETQFSNGSCGTPGGGADPGDGGGGDPGENVTTIYSRQYDQVQRMLQEGSNSLESVAEIQDLLKKNTILCKRERKIGDSVYGSSVLILCAQVSKNQALALDTNLCAFDIPSFADGILSHATNRNSERLDWSLLEKRTGRMFKRAPLISYMFGSFKPTELPRKEPKERPKKQNRVAAEKKEPEKVTNVGEKEDGNDKAVQHVHKILRRIFKNNGNQPISFFEFVLNPTEFHLTVENIFHLSFLLKNNHFAIKQNGGGLPFIHPVPPSQVGDLQKGKKLQCIVSISPDLWQTLVKVFNVREAMIPTLQ